MTPLSTAGPIIIYFRRACKCAYLFENIFIVHSEPGASPCADCESNSVRRQSIQPS